MVAFSFPVFGYTGGLYFIYPFKAHSHRGKAKISFDVYRLFYDLFACSLIFSLSLGVNKPLEPFEARINHMQRNFAFMMN